MQSITTIVPVAGRGLMRVNSCSRSEIDPPACRYTDSTIARPIFDRCNRYRRRRRKKTGGQNEKTPAVGPGYFPAMAGAQTEPAAFSVILNCYRMIASTAENAC